MKLPRGYYAVKSDFENSPKDTFTYKGVCYEVAEGDNLFATIHEANAAAAEIPTEVLEGLAYDKFDTPVILLSVGIHKPDKFTFDRSITLLGENAGIDPNLPSSNKLDPPALNPKRAVENETLLKGSYWFGKMFVMNGSAAEKIIWDGFSSTKVSFRDMRTDGSENTYFSARNIVYVSPCAYMLHLFANPGAKTNFHREVELKNIRLENYDDYSYGTNFGLITARKATLENIVYDTTAQTFGPTDIQRGKTTCELNSERSEFTIKNCYFRNLNGYNGVAISARRAGDHILDTTVESSVFIDASKAGEPPLNTYVPNENSKLTVKDCLFVDTRGNESAVANCGVHENVSIENCEFQGFRKTLCEVPELPVVAPDYIENHKSAWNSGTADAHKVIGEADADYSALDALYEGTKAYYGDQHVHTACGGTSDGKYPMKDWIKTMDEKKIDFVIIVDHRQMRGFFLPEWNEERFIMGTEPGTKMLGLNAVRLGMNDIHYNMLFPHKYGLAMVLANFPEFEFRGDELTGSFNYPSFTKERFAELTKYVQSIGGMMVHPHPRTMLVSDDPMDYYIGEHTYLETIYGAPGTAATPRNYDLWAEMLAQGKKVYVSSGSDTHGGVSNAALSTFYTKRRHSSEFFEQMRRGDYTAGEVGLKMCIDGHPMGSELEYKDGMKLTLRMDDFFEYALKDGTVYELRIVTDKGVAYASRCNGKLPQAVSIEVQKRMFYRAEVYDVSNGVWIAHGNPIWLD